MVVAGLYFWWVRGCSHLSSGLQGSTEAVSQWADWAPAWNLYVHPGWDHLAHLRSARKTDRLFYHLSSHLLPFTFTYLPFSTTLFHYLFNFTPLSTFLFFSSTFPSSLRISYLLTENKKKKKRITFTVKVEQYPRGLDDRLFSASCYYFWCTSRGKSWMELTIRLSESINQWQRNYIRSPVWAEGAGMLVLQLTEWGSATNKWPRWIFFPVLRRAQVR